MEDDEELERQIAEALLRSKQETNREESLLAEAMAASLISRDEELAMAIQREQLSHIEKTLYEDVSGNSVSHPSDPPLPADPSRQANLPRPANPPRNATSRPVPTPTPTLTPTPIPTQTPSQHCQSPRRPRAPAPRRSPQTRPNRAYVSAGSPTDSLSRSIHSPPSHSGRFGSASPTSNTYAEAVAAPVQQSPPASRLYNTRPSPPQQQGQQPTIPPLVPFVRDMRTPTVVIDGQNVGCSFGGGKHKFRSRGVELVLEYYRLKNIPAVAMLPACKVDERGDTRVADDPQLLRVLHEQGRVSFTPAGAHDDYFLLHYAMQVDADLISNDRFMKELEMQETVHDARQLRSFLDSHLIPYTFVASEFVPNPRPSQLGRDIHQSRTMRR